MTVLTSPSSLILWKEAIQLAENRLSVSLKEELEFYLISLLMRYTNKPEVAHQIFAPSFLEALHLQENQRNITLRTVGDGCLIYAGLFPGAAEKKHVTIRYFVDLGRAAYARISGDTHELYHSLALQFVLLMDVLQSIPQHSQLLPLEAYEQWHELGSKRARQILREYNASILLSPYKR